MSVSPVELWGCVGRCKVLSDVLLSCSVSSKLVGVGKSFDSFTLPSHRPSPLLDFGGGCSVCLWPLPLSLPLCKLLTLPFSLVLDVVVKEWLHLLA